MSEVKFNAISKKVSILCKTETKLYLCKDELSYLQNELRALDTNARTMIKDVENAKVKSCKLKIRMAKQEMEEKCQLIQNHARDCIGQLNRFQRKLPVI